MMLSEEVILSDKGNQLLIADVAALKSTYATNEYALKEMDVLLQTSKGKTRCDLLYAYVYGHRYELEYLQAFI
jgi:hypothetical protein